MKKITQICTALLLLLLAGCANQTQLAAPKQIEHEQKVYFLASQQDLDTLARFVYLPAGQQLQNWQSAVELLHDRQGWQQSLSDRVAMRKQVYQKTGVNNVHFKIQDEELYGAVIYEPNSCNNDWQVDVFKGKNVFDCGFVQYQYSLKIAKSNNFANMSKKKIISHLKKYVVTKSLSHLKKQSWQWSCQ